MITQYLLALAGFAGAGVGGVFIAAIMRAVENEAAASNR